MTAILLPIKNLDDAKQRQGSVLSRQQRSRLVWAMLIDMSKALNESTLADTVVVVTGDARVMQHAHRQGWEVVKENNQVSESDSVDRASMLLRKRGLDSVLRLPGDIPLLRARDVDSLMKEKIGSPGALLVPSRDGSGTNALYRSPPDVFPSHFGQNSVERHMAEARRVGVNLRLVENMRVALDLDDPVDLFDFWRIGQGTFTWKVIDEFGLMHHKVV